MKIKSTRDEYLPVFIQLLGVVLKYESWNLDWKSWTEIGIGVRELNS